MPKKSSAPRGSVDGLFLWLLFVSAVETLVPARGKALVPTDLSVAIPHGTYARIGERHNHRPSPFPSMSHFLFGLFAPRVFDEMLGRFWSRCSAVV